MTTLPIDAYLSEIVQTASKHRALVLVAEPGAGKTTRVPPAILRANLLSASHPNLVMLQPRRIATRASASRIAQENNWTLGKEAGYQVRFEKCYTDQTRLRVITEGILTRQLLDDPSLDGIGCVILDEFHERSIHCDLAIALLNDVKNSLRDDLILIVMSATLDAGPVAAYLGGCPIIKVPGRTFPVETVHIQRGNDRVEYRIADLLKAELPKTEGDVLVFLPGAEEIRKTQESLEKITDIRVLPLHGTLTFEEQQQAIAPSRDRKIVLATNIAETSLTIDGVRLVIDGGLVRKPIFDSARGLDALNLQSISKASATQRAGRAGRTAPGKCIRLWTHSEHQQLDDFDLPEIARVDLAPTLLDLHAWGESDVNQFNWYDKPPADALATAEHLLQLLGALDLRGKITQLGRKMQHMPVHPRLARLLIAAHDAGKPMLGATIAAMLSEKDFFRKQFNDRDAIGSQVMQSDSDLIVRLHALTEAERTNFDRRRLDDQIDVFAARMVCRARDQLARLVNARKDDEEDDELLCRLVLLAYPDRVCRRRGDLRTGVMVGGGGVKLDTECSVLQGELFVAIDARQDDRVKARQAIVRMASKVEASWLEELFPQSLLRTREVRFDSVKRRVQAFSILKYDDLLLKEDLGNDLDPQDAGKVLARALGNDIFNSTESVATLLARIALLKKYMPEHNWPVLDGDDLTDILAQACHGKRSEDDVREDALCDAIMGRLPYPLDRLLEQHAPVAIEVPTGNKIRIAYSTNAAPILAVRLQELFGLLQTPKVAAGRVSVLLHLLGPNYRPVQITEDLASFWKNTYFQVRKDLKVKYPKHSWPDDPLTAIPQAKGRPRQY